MGLSNSADSHFARPCGIAGLHNIEIFLIAYVLHETSLSKLLKNLILYCAHEQKAEIALGPIAVMAERETVVDFTVPYYDLVGLSILMKKPEIKPSLFKFLTVLETNVWGCILAAYFFTSFLMFVFDRLSPYSYR